MSSAGATLQGSFSGATGRINSAGFEFAESAAGLNGNGSLVYDDKCVGNVKSGQIEATLTSIKAETTYYYRAFVAEYNESTTSYEFRYGGVKSFTTGKIEDFVPQGWLELPAITGNESFVGTLYSSGTDEANRNYSYNYSFEYYASMWVAYPLSKAYLTGSASGSSDDWDYNPKFDDDKQVNVISKSYPSMYNATGYSRGHQIPNADRKCDDTMNLQTYYVTNQTPQLDDKFNGSVWQQLENAVRSIVSSGTETIYIVTGPAYKTVGGNETVSYLTGASGMGANPTSLAIPNYYWKAILRVKQNSSGEITGASAIGFWFEHKEYDSDSYTNYAVSVNEIEKKTGFDLFTNLPDVYETSAEANTSWSTFKNF